MGRSAEAWQELEEANEEQRNTEMEAMYADYQAEQRSKEFADSIWNLGCKLNADYAERLAEQADMRRKEIRENQA